MTHKIYNNDSIIKSEKSVAPVIYDLNVATMSDLDSIKGIGPAISSAIIHYRAKLGGFISTDQLKEVFGIDTILFEKIHLLLVINEIQVKKININKGFSDDLLHPYLNRSLAKLIVNYRKLHGPFKSVSELKKLALVNDELYSKLAPYLSTE